MGKNLLHGRAHVWYLKLHYGIAKARYVDLKHNAIRVGLICLPTT
jgi:hypothetical protein